MSADRPFKRPLPYSTLKSNVYTRNKGMSSKSDSEESTTSNSDVASTNTGSSSDLTIVALFDDLMRLINQKRCEKLEESFLTFAENVKSLWTQWQTTTEDCRKLQNLLDIRTQEYTEMERNLMLARKLLDQEKRKTRHAEHERDELVREIQIAKVSNLLFKDKRTKLADETREQLAFLNKGHKNSDPNSGNSLLSAIEEANSTGSILSDFSYSRFEDDLDSSKCFQTGSEWRKHTASTDAPPEPAAKKRCLSANKVVEGIISDYTPTTSPMVPAIRVTK